MQSINSSCCCSLTVGCCIIREQHVKSNGTPNVNSTATMAQQHGNTATGGDVLLENTNSLKV